MSRYMRVAGLVVLMVAGLALGASAGDQVYEKDAVLGVWKTEPNDNGDYSHVEIYLSAGST